MARLLIVDDDPDYGQMLAAMTTRLGHRSELVIDCASALESVGRGEWEAVLLDVNLPDGNGLDLIPEIKTCPSRPEVIILTGAGDPAGAELAIKSGAWDYLEKSASLSEVTLHIDRALTHRRQRNSSPARAALKRNQIIGSSPRLASCLDLVAQAAVSDAPVLITGETGTGKELFSTAIHDNSVRSGRPFVVVDCAALPESVVEGELFGYVKGAFTGADRTKEGLIARADRGTLFLDEIGDLPLPIQRSFLRVLQEHRVRPLGSTREVASDFRVVAATNRNLNSLVEQGRFRRDLFFRLQSFTIELPPLRQRKEDIRDLVLHHLGRLTKRYHLGAKGVSNELFQALNDYDWPGNVRQLVNALEQALAASGDQPTLQPQHLPVDIRVSLTQSSLGHHDQPEAGPTPGRAEKAAPADDPQTWAEFREAGLAKLEREYFRRLMEQTGDDVDRARRISGLGRSRFYQLLGKYR